MSSKLVSGIDCQGLDAAFEADEVLKSNLILEGRLLGAHQQWDDAASRFAQAAEIEERLAATCLEQGLREKAWVHQYSAASCWAQAGNFYEAILMAEGLLARPDLPSRLGRKIQEFTQALRQRRQQWFAGLALASGTIEE